MDRFDQEARGFIKQMEDAGCTIPKEQREALVERLAIIMRAAHHAASLAASLAPTNKPATESQEP